MCHVLQNLLCACRKNRDNRLFRLPFLLQYNYINGSFQSFHDGFDLWICRSRRPHDGLDDDDDVQCTLLVNTIMDLMKRPKTESIFVCRPSSSYSSKVSPILL